MEAPIRDQAPSPEGRWLRPFTEGSCASRAPVTPVGYRGPPMVTVVGRSKRVVLTVGGCGCMLATIAMAAGANGATPHQPSGTGNQILKSAIATAQEVGSVRVT